MFGTATLPAHREPTVSLPSKPITFWVSERENTSSNGLVFQSLPGKWISIPRKESVRLPVGGTDWQKEPLLSHSSAYGKWSSGNTAGKSMNAGASIQHDWLQKHFPGRLSNLPDLPFQSISGARIRAISWTSRNKEIWIWSSIQKCHKRERLKRKHCPARPWCLVSKWFLQQGWSAAAAISDGTEASLCGEGYAGHGIPCSPLPSSLKHISA